MASSAERNAYRQQNPTVGVKIYIYELSKFMEPQDDECIERDSKTQTWYLHSQHNYNYVKNMIKKTDLSYTKPYDFGINYKCNPKRQKD